MYRRVNAESLCDDYVMLIMSRPDMMDQENVKKKMAALWDIISHYELDLTNFGTVRGGGRHKKSIEAFKKMNGFLIHAVFKDQQSLKACLQEIKDRDLGVSVAISGCLEETRKICAGVDLPVHTVQYSLGIHGKQEKLPDKKVLDIATMCGHAMVSTHLITDLIGKIGKGKITHAKAADTLSRMCDCGIFNPHRAERLLRKMV